MIEKERYPISVLARQMEREWAEELALYYGRAPAEIAEDPWFSYLTVRLRIEVMDESCMEFHNAIFIVSEPKRALAGFTEHCGHHLYPNHDAHRNAELVYEQVQLTCPFSDG